MDTPSYLRMAVMKLSRGIGIRSHQDHDKLEQAVRYLSAELSSFGYDVAKQSFTFAGHTYQNIIAELKGTVSPEQVLVVGAHYDTVRTTPGADDNASGVAGLLGLARLFADRPLGKTVRFVAFPLEEPPAYRTRNMGSYHYAESLKKASEQVEGMICLEMIGFFSDQLGSQHYPIPFMNLKFPKAGNYTWREPLLLKLPFQFIVLGYVRTIKLRKSPFDLATSHHAHQELVKGSTTEMAGPWLALAELGHWYEAAFVMGLVLLSALQSPLLAVALVLVTYLVVVLVDNTLPQATWRAALGVAWGLGGVAAAIALVTSHLAGGG